MHQMMGDPGTSDAMLPHPTFEIPRRHEFQGQAPSSALEPSVFSFSNSLHRQPPPFFQPLHRPAESFRQDGCEEWSSRDSQLGAGSPTGLRDCVEDQVPGLFCPSEDTRDVMTRARVGEDDLFTFPEGEHDAVTMTARDLASLQPGKFLTDNTIDFYIRYLKEKIVSPGNQNEFHFFNSFFFTKLLEKSSSAGIDECKVDYEKLRMWTADVNLFEKDYVFIPIIESSHWSLIVLCHLKSLNPSSHVERKGRPCILHLDPIEGKHEHFEGQVRSYILQAWTERTRALYNMDALHSLVQMKYVQAKVPQQDNTYDCGLYVLHYIEVFLFKWTSQDLNVLSSQGGANFTRRNFKMEVFDKRNYIQGLIFKVGGMVQVEDDNLFDTNIHHQDKVGLVHSPRHQHQHSPKLAKESKSKKWKEIETSILLQCMVDGGCFCNGKRGAMHWDLIAEAINLKSNGGLLRSKEQCQNRFDTLLKAYKDLNAYCEHIGKTFCEVTDDEKQSLKLATPLEKKDEGWYNSLHTIYCWRSSLSRKSGKCRILKLDDDIGNSKLTSSPLKSLRECATPFNLIESLESQKTSSRQAAFVKARNHQLPSHSQMPSTTWIPESRAHNTSTDKVTSFEPRDINSGKNCISDIINKHHVTASVQCDGHKTKQPSSELQWMSVGFLPPLMESGMDLETNLDLQPSTSYWSDVLRGTVGNFPDNDLWLRNQLSRPNVNLTDLTCPGFEVTPAETSFPTIYDNDFNNYRWIDARKNPRMCIPTNSKAQTPPQRSPRSSCKPGASQYRGVRFRPEFQKWTAEIGVSKWKAVQKKVWLGMFDTEQAAARAFDVARKLVKCTKKYPLNLPCEKLEVYSRQIPAQLTDMTDISMFYQVVVFIKHECQAYAARFDDMLIEQINPAFDRHDSFGDQFFNPTSSVNHATHGYENMPPSNSSDVLNVDVHSESEFLDMILDFTDLTCPGFELTPAETSFPTFDDNDFNNYRWSDARTNPRMCIPTNRKAQTPPQRPPRSSCKPGPSQYRGVRFRPDLHKWVAEIRVAEWKAVDKKVWLGTFVTEQAAARAFDLARKLLKCSKKYPLNLPCEKLDAYSRQIPAQLILTDLTDTSMFKQVTVFIRRECRAYAASFDDTPSGQINPAFDRHDSPVFGDQFFNPTSIINQTAQWFENMFFSKSSEAHNVDDLLEWDMSLVPL